MDQLRQHIHAIEAGSVKCIVGPEFDDVRRKIEEAFTAGEPAVLIRRLSEVPPAAELIDDLISRLADAALGLWPAWYPHADGGLVPDPTPDSPYLRRQLRRLLAGLPRLSVNWALRAIAAASSGRSPGLPQFTREVQLQQLGLAVSGVGLRIVIVLDAREQSDAGLENLVHAAEWLARQGEMAVALMIPAELAHRSALERVMFGAVALSQPDGHTDWREVDEANGHPSRALPSHPAEANDVWLWPVLGRPHPNSPGELKLAQALMADAELSALFRFNQRVETVHKSHPIVDLLWEDGRVVVEIDGRTHWQPDQYAADRHRDFQLLVTGYLVLRLPHDEVMRDTEHAVEKIRNVVEYRRGTQQTMERRP